MLVPTVVVAAADHDGGRNMRAELTSNADAGVQGGLGRITFSAGDAGVVFSVYSITGQLLRTVSLAAGAQTSIEMPKGFYIVRCGSQWSRKVVVR